MINEKHRMLLPEDVEIFKNDVLIASLTKQSYQVQDHIAGLVYPIMLYENDRLQIRIKKNINMDNSIIACDEIQIH
ncbi:hypothetical protein OKW96_05590 [Sphingobacterium sp. KU25419]|nr:hypothetical protein OKW96_05590 [Sphingobacterium sp. KU25419]